MRKIFLVEDNEAIREILEIFLTSENYNVKSFATVEEFAARDVCETPDLYLFDVMLPDGSGIDLCRQIKEDHDNKNIPVIIMSAHAGLGHFENLCEPEDFIAKPFDIDHVLEKIRNLFN